MSGKPEKIEGTEAAARFDALVRKALPVPHSQINEARGGV
jgi:hypothetical protein